MLENNLERFSESLFLFLTNQTVCVKVVILKKHAENFQTYGEYSFPSSLKPWNEFIVKPSTQSAASADVTLLQFIGKSHDDILKEAKTWNLKVKNFKEEKGRVFLFLERPHAISVGLSEGLKNTLFVSQRLQEHYGVVRIDPLCEQVECLTSLRVKYLSKVVENLCSIRLCRDSKLPEIFVTSKSSSSCAGFKILCGPVLSSKTSKKEIDMNAGDFIRSRHDEMTRIAQHKYGIRVTTDPKWQEFIKHLGESAAAFELLQIKPSSVVKINCDYMTGGMSKGAAFILYNCARLETIIRTYNDNVDKGIYPALPDFDEIDFSLLTQEDEWNLIFNYIMGFPSLLESCLEFKDEKCEFRPHFMCSFLCSMVRVFSQYYRKTRILVEPRRHLLPAVYARIYMLRILNDTLKTCLKILNIKSVSQM